MKDAALDVIRKSRALIGNDHFVGNAGVHLSDYFHKDWCYRSPRTTKWLAEALARKISIQSHINFDRLHVVVAPEKGAIILGHLVAGYLDRRYRNETDPEILSVYAEKERDKDGKETGRFIFSKKRLYSGTAELKNIYIIEDVTTTGGSVERVIELCRSLGSDVLGVGVLWNRGGATAESLGVPEVISLIDEKLPTFDLNKGPCPMCQSNMPIRQDLGHGRKFLALAAQYGAADVMAHWHEAV